MGKEDQLPTKEGKANIDGNPLYFAQATSDGNTRTDGSGNVKERGPVSNFFQSFFNIPNGNDSLDQQPSQYLIDRPIRESLTPNQYESYRKKVEEFDIKLQKSESQILNDTKINNLLIAEQLTLKSLSENRKKLVDDFKRKIFDDIKIN
ncbi:MAG: hypothetical protein MH321_00665 [Leptospiraceae bacterium]|nr:hypothetical protein [Leptospiraceae bacterium]